MAFKTITIDTEAYDILAAQKRENESFSKLIKRRLRPGHTASALLADLPKLTLSIETLDHADTLVRARADSPVDSPRLDED